MNAAAPSIQQIKEAMRAAWKAGDFGVIAKTMSGVADEFIARLPIAAGARALDVACGTGNAALPLARRGAVVTGLDIAANLLAQARERAAAENLDIAFDEGDAEQLPYADVSFDLVVSMFGAMFAPRPDLVETEFARVLKPGGLLAMANWTPASFSGAVFQVTGRHVAPPPGIAPPVLWGDETTVRERLGGSFHNIQTEIISIDSDFPFAPPGMVAFFRKYFGPTQMAFSRMDETGQAALAADLELLFAKANTASDADSHTVIHNEYLQVLATRA